MAAARARRPLATEDIASTCETLIDALRRLDDEEGGSLAALGLVENQLDTISTYLTKGRFTSPAVRARLVTASAQLNQLAGWMAFEIQEDQLGWRYFRSALTAAREANQPGVIAYVLGYMSYQDAIRGDAAEAGQLAAVAARVARGAHPMVRALMVARVAQAAAVAGDAPGYESASARARGLYERAGNEGDTPGYLYWFDSTMINTVQGESGLLLAGRAGHHGLLRRVDGLLRAEIAGEPATRGRNALLYGAWLARSHLKRGDVGRATELAELAADHLELVRSKRALAMFYGLRKDLLRHRKLGWRRVRHLYRRLRVRDRRERG